MRYKDISIHKKILLTNFLMILIPVLFVCMILALLLLGFSTLTDSSSSLLRNVLLNSSNYGPTLLIKSLNDELSEHTVIDKDAIGIFQELEKAHLHIMITKDDELYYITDGYTPDSLQQEFTSIAETEAYRTPYILWNQNGMAYAATLQNKADETWMITFSGNNLRFPKNSYASWEETKLNIKIGIIATGFFMILLILLLGIFLTKRLSRHILTPLSQLQQASNAIKLGDLNTRIVSESGDEFGMLCENFEAMREQLVESQNRQTQYQTQRKELIAGISHDLSTPLTSIQGYVNALHDEIADTPQQQQHYLEIIQNKTTQMNDLVDSLFLLSKLDMEEEPLTLTPTDLDSFVKEWVEEEYEHFKERSLEIHYHDAMQPLFVDMDRVHFVRVLSNLCENSMKYKKGIAAQMNITLKREAQSCLLSFQDDGCGASQEDIAHLFERFYRADPARSSKIKGNGLGLAITRHIIEAMQGSIWAEGAVGAGLCIYIRLPLIREKSL